MFFSCADSESFVRGVQLLKNVFFFFLFCFSWCREEGSKCHNKRVIIGPPFNGVSLECQWWPNFECWLGSFVIFRGSGPVLLENSSGAIGLSAVLNWVFSWSYSLIISIVLWFFSGVPDPCPLPILLWIRKCADQTTQSDLCKCFFTFWTNTNSILSVL